MFKTQLLGFIFTVNCDVFRSVDVSVQVLDPVSTFNLMSDCYIELDPRVDTVDVSVFVVIGFRKHVVDGLHSCGDWPDFAQFLPSEAHYKILAQYSMSGKYPIYVKNTSM